MEAVLFFWCGAVDTRNVVWIGSVLGVLAVLMVVGYWLVRRLTVSGRGEKEENTAFTLEQIRQLHQEGQLSDEEYQSLREKIIQEARLG